MTLERSVRNCGKPHGRTGPRSRAGKTSVRHNRWRHGLGAALSLHPEVAADVERLASELGEGSDPLVRAYAARIAEAELSLLRARQTKILTIETAWRERTNARKGAALIKLAMQMTRKALTSSQIATWMRDLSAINCADGPDSNTAAFTTALPELLKLDRYERRAFSMRRRAVTLLVTARLLASATRGRPLEG